MQCCRATAVESASDRFTRKESALNGNNEGLYFLENLVEACMQDGTAFMRRFRYAAPRSR
jgi:hypothetical protein